MRSEALFTKEEQTARTSVEGAARQAATENRARWADVFEEVDPGDLPEDGGLVFFATVDAYTVMGPVRAGRFFAVPGDSAAAFEPSRTFLAASREGLRRLTALHVELLMAGPASRAAEVDLRPVRPLGEARTQGRSEPRVADGSEAT